MDDNLGFLFTFPCKDQTFSDMVCVLGLGGIFDKELQAKKQTRFFFFFNKTRRTYPVFPVVQTVDMVVFQRSP